MRPPFKSNNQQLGTSSSSDAAMFNNLWVGNLAADVTDSDLRNLFEKYGGVDTVTCYPARSYAFVNMNRPEDAKRAKDAIQGFVLRGGALKIDFAKPVCIALLGFPISFYLFLINGMLYGFKFCSVCVFFIDYSVYVIVLALQIIKHPKI